MSKPHDILIAPLTREAFAPFGDVIDTSDVAPIAINQGFANRYNDLANIDVQTDGGKVCAAIFEARVRPNPIEIKIMERHPLGSQLFVPLQDTPWLVVVCVTPLLASSYCAFMATGRQGVNYRRNTWHHPLLVLEDVSRFMVVDRAGSGNNLEEIWLPPTSLVQVSC